MRRDLGDGIRARRRRRSGSTSTRCTASCRESQLLGAGRPRETQDRLSARPHASSASTTSERQVGFCRAATDGTSFVYLADVYVLQEYRGRGLGEELVREMVENGPFAGVRWLLHTTNMHPLYRKFGFAEPDFKVMERPAGYASRRPAR